MIFKACSKCGRVHPISYDCKVKRIYEHTEESQLRSQYSWTQKSKEIRERANHLCEVCRDKKIYTCNGLEVHHITKVKDDNSLLLDNYNLICLCVEHHKQADRGEIDAEYLRQLAKKREDAQ